jgi:hypothetical protein
MSGRRPGDSVRTAIIIDICVAVQFAGIAAAGYSGVYD